MARGRSFDAAAVEDALLRRPEIELKGLFRGSSNYTFLAELCAPAGERLLAVYKPARGESPLWDFPAGTLYRREVAAYRLARSLGWPRIPPTVVRAEAPHGVGALQMFVTANPARHYLAADPAVPPLRWLELAVFDVVTNNADRKSGHCLCDADGEIWAIDHGLTFHTDPKLRTVIWDYAGRRLPEELRGDLERAAGELRSGELAGALGELLSRRELRGTSRRLEAVLRPEFQLPRPASAWSVPWPPI